MTKLLWRVVAAGAVTVFIASGAGVSATASTRTECVPDASYGACRIADYSDVVPAEVVTVRGSGQAAEAGAWFESSLVARVQTGPDLGEPNVSVTFTIVGTSGSRFAVSADPNVRVSRDGSTVTVTSVNDPGSPARHGTAETPRLIAGQSPGAFAVRADVAGVGVPAVFELAVVAGAVTQLVRDSGHGQSAAPYTPFDHNLRVVARNSAGSPVEGVPVTFLIEGPTGSTFADGTVRSTGYTDVAGLAGSARVYAGDSGPLAVVAWVEGGPSVTFELTVAGSTHLHKNPVTGELW